MFQRILVANRGEIALRVIRACKELGIEVVAVYSQADRDAPYLRLADRAICIGKAPSVDSYLNHPGSSPRPKSPTSRRSIPGYGFLSENPHFAEVCRSSRLRVHRPAARGDPQDGPEDRGQSGRRRGQGRLRARLRRPGHPATPRRSGWPARSAIPC